MEKSKEPLWKNQRDSFRSALEYMQGRMRGEIKSLQTPWSKFNDAGIDGIEWNSTVVIGARPGTGKTLIKDQLVREAFIRNPGEGIRALEFQLEMMGRVSAMREYSAILAKPYKYVCSADKLQGKLTTEDFDRCINYAQKRVEYPIDVVDTACTVKTFKYIIEQYMETYAVTISGKKIYQKTIVTLDHTILLKRDVNESTLNDMLYSLGEALTDLKRRYPIIFIILSQLNRNIDSPERAEDGRQGNYILTSDIFGADALLQHADMLVGIDRPAGRNIFYYGPSRYIVDSEDLLVGHFLKCRNGDTRISFFKAEFDKMRMVEIPTPPTQTQQRNIKTQKV